MWRDTATSVMAAFDSHLHCSLKSISSGLHPGTAAGTQTAPPRKLALPAKLAPVPAFLLAAHSRYPRASGHDPAHQPQLSHRRSASPRTVRRLLVPLSTLGMAVPPLATPSTRMLPLKKPSCSGRSRCKQREPEFEL